MAAQLLGGYWYPLFPVIMSGPSLITIDQNSEPKSTIPYPLPSVRFANRHNIGIREQDQAIDLGTAGMPPAYRDTLLAAYDEDCPDFRSKIRFFCEGAKSLLEEQRTEVDPNGDEYNIYRDMYVNGNGDEVPVKLFCSLLKTTLLDIRTRTRNPEQRQYCRALLDAKRAQLDRKIDMISNLMTHLSIVSACCVLPPYDTTREEISEEINFLYSASVMLGDIELQYVAQIQLLDVLEGQLPSMAPFLHMNF